MNPHHYCQQQVAAPGSNLYYSTRFLPETTQEALIALHAFGEELLTLSRRCQEPKVAAMKLAWWRSEVAHIVACNSQHPIGRALSEARNRFDLPENLFYTLIDEMEKMLTVAEFATFNDWLLHCHQSTSVIYLLNAYVLAPITPSTLTFCRDVGATIQLIYNIQNLRKHLKSGFNPLAIADLAHYDINVNDLLHYKKMDQLPQLLQHYANKARELHTNALSALTSSEKRSLLSLLVLAQLQLSLLAEIDQEGFLVLEQYTELTPLRKRWLAFQTRRRLHISD